MNVNIETSLHKKLFGQFFSGEKVAKLLYSLLPEDIICESVIDPMAGIGDMLKTAKDNSPNSTKVLGVEIDKTVAEECAFNIPNAEIINADAFCTDAVITESGWDLVITNPPYVRYQLQGTDAGGIMPTGKEIRANLICQIEKLKYIKGEEKELFLNISKNYSGLSDMAVPSWILCAALVKNGGHLAIVVPETWLNRDYASPIQYLLSKLFHVETIAKDSDGNWFPEALVKTCLVIAKRKELSNSQNTEYAKTKLIEIDENGKIIKIDNQNTDSLFPHMLTGKDVNRWILKEDEELFEEEKGLPYEINKLFGCEKAVRYITLSEMGIECGQGLRTGANDFFYVTILQRKGERYIIQSNDWDYGGKKYCVPNSNLILSLQKRGDVEGLVVRGSDLRKGVVYLKSRAKGDLKEYTDAGEKYTNENGKKFRDYSAVKPNEKLVDGKTVRYWYMLPRFTDRHCPTLCMTRLSSGVAECLYVEQTEGERLAVDANMVTLWSKNKATDKAIFAVLNSTWVKLYLESICTVMGGGALKIETSHLKKLLIPYLSQEQICGLKRIGEELITIGFMNEEIQNKIDKIIFSAFTNKKSISDAKDLLSKKLKERSKK